MDDRHVKALIEKMRSDVEFRERVLAIKELEARMELIKNEGFECKIGDVQLYLSHITSSDGSQAVVFTEMGGCKGIYYGFCF
ncbi:MAG TPA: Nif11-like leader peptide family RiPP precursor [Candidatus Sulfotelmatobacter sp.]|jgi:predicted ribosomally synthesized peptide with nif11-like leader|nr:Nif11-like leader peptide family RiPP precursor [Candidatus Sulfotelmatobacter sp.]